MCTTNKEGLESYIQSRCLFVQTCNLCLHKNASHCLQENCTPQKLRKQQRGTNTDLGCQLCCGLPGGTCGSWLGCLPWPCGPPAQTAPAAWSPSPAQPQPLVPQPRPLVPQPAELLRPAQPAGAAPFLHAHSASMAKFSSFGQKL